MISLILLLISYYKSEGANIMIKHVKISNEYHWTKLVYDWSTISSFIQHVSHCYYDDITIM